MVVKKCAKQNSFLSSGAECYGCVHETSKIGAQNRGLSHGDISETARTPGLLRQHFFGYQLTYLLCDGKQKRVRVVNV